MFRILYAKGLPYFSRKWVVSKTSVFKTAAGHRAGLANPHKNCCNTCLEINISKPLIRVEF